MTEGVVLSDSDGLITYTNRALDEMFGFVSGELLGQNALILNKYLSQENLALDYKIQATTASHGSWYGELQCCKHDGTPFACSVRISILEEGDARYWIRTFTDITKHKQQEQELGLIRNVMDRVQDGVRIMDKQGRFVFVNDRMCQEFGISREELLASTIQEIVPEDYPNIEVWDKYFDTVRTQNSFSLETTIARRDGSKYIAEVNKSYVEVGGKEYIFGFVHDITERRRRQDLLHKTANLLTNIINSSKDMIFVKDTELRTILCNSVYSQALGKKPEEMYGQTDIENGWLPDVVYGNEAKGIRGFQSDDKKVLLGETIHNPHDLTNIGGQFMIFDTVKAPLYDETGEIIGLLGIARNVTVQNESEQQLQRLSLVASKTTHAVTITDAEGRITWVNEGFIRLTEYTLPEALGKRPGHLLQGSETNPNTVQIMRNGLQLGHGFDVEILNYTKSQNSYWVHIKVDPFYNNNNELEGFISIETDINERKRAEKFLLYQKELLSSVIDSMMDGVVLLNADHQITLINSALESMFGYDSGELIFQPLSVLIPLQSQEIHKRNIQSFQNNGGNSVARYKSHSVMGRRKDGMTFPIEASIAHFEVDNQLFLLAVVRDITKRIEAEEEILQLNNTLTSKVEKRTAALTKLNQEKDEFLNMATHDLKNPLAAIRTSAQIITDCFVGGVEVDYAEYADSIITMCDDMLDIITNFLDIELIESGKIGMAMEHIPSNIVGKVIETHRKRAAKKDISFHYIEPSNQMLFIADRFALRQVLDNLLSNAVKFSPYSKQIFINVLERKKEDENERAGVLDERRVRIEIRDEGPGLGKEEQARLFTKFSRLSAKPTGEEGSTGLGLSIVKKLVEMMNGRVWCESVKGEGATFIVELPLL